QQGRVGDGAVVQLDTGVEGWPRLCEVDRAVDRETPAGGASLAEDAEERTAVVRPDRELPPPQRDAEVSGARLPARRRVDGVGVDRAPGRPVRAPRRARGDGHRPVEQRAGIEPERGATGTI